MVVVESDYCVIISAELFIVDIIIACGQIELELLYESITNCYLRLIKAGK